MADALKIGMVMLGAKDMKDSVAFYRDKVGFAVQFESRNCITVSKAELIVSMVSVWTPTGS